MMIKKILSLLIAFSLISAPLVTAPCYGALTADIEWEIRPDGTSSNGGGYDTTSDGGTDRVIGNDGAGSNEDVDGATPDAVGPPYTFTSVAGSFSAKDVGNCLTILDTGDGTNATLDIYEIASINSATSIEVNAGEINGNPPASGAETGIDWVTGGYKTHSALTMTQSATTLTSPTDFFTGSDVDNIIFVQSGANFDSGWYQIATFTDSNNVVLDRTAASGGNGSAGNATIGGATQFHDALFEAWTVGNKGHVKSGTHTISAGITVANDGTIASPMVIEGYDSSRGDAPTGDNKPLIAAGANAVSFDQYWRFFHMRMTTTHAEGWDTNSGNLFYNIEVNNSSGTSNRAAIRPYFNNNSVINCEGQSVNGNAVFTYHDSFIAYGYFHDSDIGINLSNGIDSHTVIGNVVDTCGSAGITLDTQSDRAFILNNTIYNCAVGIEALSNPEEFIVLNNILDANVVGAEWTSTDNGTSLWDYNIWDNTTDVTNVTKGLNAIDGDPGLTDPANGDFTVGSGSNALDTALQIGTDVGVVGDYKWNIGVDQDDNTVGGGGGSPIGWVSVAE